MAVLEKVQRFCCITSSLNIVGTFGVFIFNFEWCIHPTFPKNNMSGWENVIRLSSTGKRRQTSKWSWPKSPRRSTRPAQGLLMRAMCFSQPKKPWDYVLFFDRGFFRERGTVSVHFFHLVVISQVSWFKTLIHVREI